MKKTNLRKLIIFLLIIFLLSPDFIGLANIEKEEVIYINSVRDLEEFAKNSSFDLWSRNKKVILERDLDLLSISFNPIPIFSGTFDGQNHTIKGLFIDIEGSNYGLFRYLEEDGIIKNLKIEGTISPGGDKINIGGLVGNNRGTIENCSFSGLVNGKEKIGGLVGFNNSMGKIIGSSSDGVMYGDKMVGGLVGYNNGTILNSINYSSVNTRVEEHKINLEEISLENINPIKDFLDATDLGGVAGVNTGIIQGAENHGTIGYPHVGYNVGGIAGRQSGYINKSLNYGQILGRKEVAGIVGQMEPHVDTIIEPSKLKDLQVELNKLHKKIDTMVDDIQIISDISSQDMGEIKENLEKTKLHAQSLIDQTEEMLNKDIDEINRISLIGVETLELLLPILDTMEELIEVMGKASSSIQQSMYYMARAMGDLSHMAQEMEYMTIQMEKAMKDLDRAQAYGVKALSILKKIVEKLMENFEGLDDPPEFSGLEDIEGLLAYLLELRLDPETIREILDLLEEFEKEINLMSESINSGIKNMDASFKRVKNITKDMKDMSKDLERSIDFIVVAMEIMKPMEGKTTKLLGDFKKLISYLKDNMELDFQTTDDKYQETKEDLFSSMDTMVASIFNLMENVTGQSKSLTDDFKALDDQLFVVINLMIDLISDLTSEPLEKEDIIKDVSRHDVESKVEGKIDNCENYGQVEGDINVGGIAGAMAMELGFDQEEDFSISKFTPNTIYETRVILLNSNNYGHIIGKKNNVGGIVGNMDLGYLKNTISTGQVESLDGSYVGGIAGLSNSVITSSYAKTKLKGKDYIGGIAGFGLEINNSYSMVEILEAKAYIGAIAGQVEEKAKIEFNYFISDKLHGIDMISYGGRAEPINYESLLEKQDIPQVFRKFKLKFIVDGEEIHEHSFDYGDSIEDINYPNISHKEGYYSRWEDYKEKILKFDTNIMGTYIPYISVLESKEKREEVLSIILVEGKFTDKDKLVLDENHEIEFPTFENKTFIESWNLKIPEDDNPSHLISYLIGQEKNIEIYQYRDNEWYKLDTKIDGKYLKFTGEGYDLTFSAYKANKVININMLLVILGIIILVLLIFILINKKRRKNI